jgi:hypothetical protein
MKRLCIVLLACPLLMTACGIPSTFPNNQATIAVGAFQTLTSQTNNNTAIAQTVMAASSPQPTQPLASTTIAPQITPTSIPSSGSAPSISFSHVPPIGSHDDLEGVVQGVDPAKYVVAIYISVDGGWWTKPTFASPTTPISSDGTWSAPYATGGNDISATAIVAYLIPIGYNPPAMAGGATLPSDLGANAVAKAEATR